MIPLHQRELVLASRFSGADHIWVSIDHPAGTVIPLLLVLATLNTGHVVLHVTEMSSLGLGVTALTAGWGVMINDARQYIWTQPPQMFRPGLVLLISVMASDLVDDTLRDHLDPRLVMEHAH